MPFSVCVTAARTVLRGQGHDRACMRAHRAQAEGTSVEAMQEQVARATSVPARRQFLVVAEERARGASLGHLAKRVQARRAGPRSIVHAGGCSTYWLPLYIYFHNHIK